MWCRPGVCKRFCPTKLFARCNGVGATDIEFDASPEIAIGAAWEQCHHRNWETSGVTRSNRASVYHQWFTSSAHHQTAIDRQSVRRPQQADLLLAVKYGLLVQLVTDYCMVPAYYSNSSFVIIVHFIICLLIVKYIVLHQGPIGVYPIRRNRIRRN